MHLQHETSDAEKKIRPELVVVSPMSRALMTSNIAFAHLIDPGGGGESEGANEAPSCKFLAHEGCREKVNGHACNFRRSVQEMKNEFPNVDFSLLQHQHDRLLVLTHERTISCACIARCSTLFELALPPGFWSKELPWSQVQTRQNARLSLWSGYETGLRQRSWCRRTLIGFLRCLILSWQPMKVQAAGGLGLCSLCVLCSTPGR